MATTEEDGFLQEPETAGRSVEDQSRGAEQSRGAAKRSAAEAPDARSGETASKRAKKAARTHKAPGSSSAAISDPNRRIQKDGDGLKGKNPQNVRPDAACYSGAEEIRRGLSQSTSEGAETADAFVPHLIHLQPLLPDQRRSAAK
ncbi:UNVERIFIED_CONTAM: hypothetical protein K2H54_044342 [Gekko kuhli]